MLGDRFAWLLSSVVLAALGGCGPNVIPGTPPRPPTAGPQVGPTDPTPR